MTPRKIFESTCSGFKNFRKKKLLQQNLKFWKHFCTCIEIILLCNIFFRLITKIITLKKEVSELRKQQLLQSSDERYCNQFHWLYVLYALFSLPNLMKGSGEFYRIKICQLFIRFVVSVSIQSRNFTFSSSTLGPFGQFQYQTCGCQWDFCFTCLKELVLLYYFSKYNT